MELTETVRLMERIKQHYQEFIIDDYKIDEWHNELNKYDFKEVNDKLEQHMRSEQYGQYIPKLFFLTRNLRTIEQKQEKKEYIVICPVCKSYVNFEKYNDHVQRCNSVEFLYEQCKRLNLKPIDKTIFKKMSQEQFDEYYFKLIDYTYKNTNDEKELKRIYAIKQSKLGEKVEFSVDYI